MPNLIGAGGRLLAEQKPPGPDPNSFTVDNTRQQYFNSPYYLAHQNQTLPVPPPRVLPSRMNLADVLDHNTVGAIEAANRIVFHSVGDTGVDQTSHLPNEESVADMMSGDVDAGGANAPSFLFHLGDVIYDFGEGEYYYDQFYDPFRAYDRPIFAIPGNHDGVVYGDASSGTPPSLEAFLRNFCTPTPGLSPDAGSLVRSTMTQPGAYFTLEAPFVSIIGLYSNVLEGPGVISSQGASYPNVGNDQIAFLVSELTRLKPLRQAGQRAVLLAVHHPPLSVDSKHGGSTGLVGDITAACTQAGFWPDAVLSGHAHLYERFSLAVGSGKVPFVVSGSGGHNVTPPAGGAPKAPATIGDATLEVDPIMEYGYLTVTVDMTGATKTLDITFNSVKSGLGTDNVTVNLA